MKKFKLVFILLIMMFFTVYLSRYNTSYNENNRILTDEAIERFEKDLKEGKEIKTSNYLVKEKNYNNKPSIIGLKISNTIEKYFNNTMKYLIKYLDNLEN